MIDDFLDIGDVPIEYMLDDEPVIGSGSEDEDREQDTDSRKQYTEGIGSYVPNHLALPIVDDDCRFLLRNEKFYCKRHKMLKKKMEELGGCKFIYEAVNDPYACIKGILLDEGTINVHEMKSDLDKTLDAAVTSLKIHKINLIGRSMTGEVMQGLERQTRDLLYQLRKKVPDMLGSYLEMRKVERIKEQICCRRIKFGELIRYQARLYLERDIFFLEIQQGTWVIGPTNLILCVLDIYQSRFPKKLYWLLSDILKKYPSSMFQVGTFLISEFEKIRRYLKNDFYKFIATWESLVLGYAINDSDNDLGFSELYDTSLTSMREILVKYNFEYDILRLLPPDRSTDSIKMYIELLGNTKHFGHPCLEIEAGFENVRNFGTESVLIDLDIAKMGAAIMRRDFVKNFLSKRKKWPPCKNLPKEFLPFFKRARLPVQHEKDYHLWSEVRFSKVFDYDMSPDTSELIKDSSAADRMRDWYCNYDTCAFRIRYGKPRPAVHPGRKPTRVVQRFLTGNEFDLDKKIYELSRNYFDSQDNTASLCRKEQELKPDGRLFVKQTYEQRLAQTSMEANIANQYMKFMPEQTMTDGEIQLTRRLADTAKNQKRSQLEILNLDLSKWNMRFRHALVHWYGVVLDEVFDSGDLYKNNHIWFINSQVFCNSRLAPPDYTENLEPVPGPFYYNNQLGGMEGMRQKLWTIITVCLIKLSAESCDMHINIMCQGDNQVVMIHYQELTLEERRAKREVFLNTLRTNLGAVNLILKTEETWFSSRLCEFGKTRYFDGEAISNGDKKINRCIPDINDGVCSIMSSLSTINTITEATAKCDYMPDASFLINQIMVLGYLGRKKVLSATCDAKTRLAYLYHPTDFGGICLSTLFSHSIRGFDDKLTIWISLLQTLKTYSPEAYKITRSLNSVAPLGGTPNYAKLIEDIFSLNIRNLPSVEKKIKNLALLYLQSKNVTNPEIIKIFKGSSELTKDTIVQDLVSMDPFLPSLAHEILRNSNTGILLSLRNRFSNINTINKIIQDLPAADLQTITRDISYNRDIPHSTDHYDFLTIADINNKKVIEILQKRIKGKDSFYLDPFIDMDCPTKASEELRKLHWGLNIIGASKPYPPCQFRLADLDNCTRAEKDMAILVSLSGELSGVESINYLKDGPYVAYLGSATKEKVKKPSLEILSKTSFTKALQHLHLLRSWCQRLRSENLVLLIDRLIDEKTDLIPEELEDFDMDDWCASVWGGNILHRFRSLIEKDAAVINFLPTVATHILQTTNNLAGITAGGKDFTIHFQMVLIYNIFCLTKLKEHSYLGTKQFASILCCQTCTKEVTSVSLDIAKPSHTLESGISSNIECSGSLRVSDQYYNNDEIIFAISVHLGRQFGKACDSQFVQGYVIDKVRSSKKLARELVSVSVNDMRYIDFDYFTGSLIAASKTIKDTLLKYSNFDLIIQRAEYLEGLGAFLHNSGMTESYLNYLAVPIVRHYEALDAKLTSRVLFTGIFLWARNHFALLGSILIDKIFTSDSDDFTFSNQRWLAKFLLTLRIGNYQRLRQSQLSYHNLVKNKIILQSVHPFGNLYHLNRRMDEEKAIFYLRNRITSGQMQPSLRTLTITRLNINDISLVSSHLLLLTKSYYHYLSQLDSGPWRFRDIQHICRPQGSISTAISKILEIIILLNSSISDVSAIYCIAEGSGSILEGLASIYPDATLFYNTILLPSIDMRQGADQNYPPSLMTSRYVSLGRICPWSELAQGETDITTVAFMVKLEDHFVRHPPDIITMDAESTEAITNVEIFYLHVKLLVKYVKSLIIYKMLITPDNIPLCNELNTLSPEFYFVLMKPISSGPNNLEHYMVGFRKSRVSDNYIQRLEEISLLSLSTLGANKMSSLDSWEYYLALSYERNDTVNRVFGELTRLPLDEILIDPQTGGCGLFCKITLVHLLETLQRLHTFDNSQEIYYPIIRHGGIQGNINNIFHLILCIIYITMCRDTEQCLFRLMTVPGEYYIRYFDDKHKKEGPVADNFESWKWFLRTLCIGYRGVPPRCRCHPVNANWTPQTDISMDTFYWGWKKVLEMLTSRRVTIEELRDSLGLRR